MTSPQPDETVGALGVDIVPDASQFGTRLREGTIPEAEKIGREIAARIASPIASGISEAIRDGLRRASGSTADAAKVGAEIGEAIGKAAKERIDAVLKDVKVDIGVDAVRVSAEIDKIRLLLDRLDGRTVTIRVDVETTTAMLRLRTLVALLAAIEGRTARVRVDVDTQGAHAGLRGVGAEADNAGEKVKKVGEQASGGVSGFSLLATAGITLSSALIPAAASAVALGGALTTGMLAGGAALAVVTFAMKGVIEAVGAMQQAQMTATQAASQSLAQHMAMTSALIGIRDAYHGVEQAQLALAAAGRGVDAANHGVELAQRALTNAERDELLALHELDLARKAEREGLLDLESQIAANAISRRQAALDEARAARDLRLIQANPYASSLNIEQAQIAMDQARLHTSDLSTQQRRLSEQKALADRQGVGGSDAVVAATTRVSEAHNQVAEAHYNVGNAQQSQADAVQRVTDAHYGLLKATEQVTAAQQQLVATELQAALVGDQLRHTMSLLSPEAQRFAEFLFSLKPVMADLQHAAERGFLPGLQAGITAMLPVIPQVIVFIERISGAMGGLAEQAGKTLSSPFWVSFFDWLGTTAAKYLEQFGTTIWALAQGFATLLMAFGPTSDKIIAGFTDMAVAFAGWAGEFVKSKGFQDFIAYVTRNAPLLSQLLGDMLIVALKLAIAFAPLGELILKGLVVLFEWLAKQDPGVLLAIAAGIAGIVGAIILIAGGSVTAIVAVITVIVGALVWAYTHFKWLRDIVDEVASAWWSFAVFMAHFYKAVWDDVLVPAFNWLKKELPIVGAFFSDLWEHWIRPALTAIGDAVKWLYEKAIKPAFDFIVAAIMWAWQNVIEPTLFAISWFVSNVLGPAFHWLYHNVIKPIWDGIVVAIKIAWAILEVIFGVTQIAVKILAAPFIWFYDHVIKPVWDSVSKHVSDIWHKDVQPVLKSLGEYIEIHVAPKIKSGVEVLKKIWTTLVDIFKAPIKVFVEYVLNQGLFSAYNKVAKIFHVKPDDVHVDLPAGFATGGLISGPGTGTSDSILAKVAGGPMIRVSNGEYIIPAAKVAEFGVGFWDYLIGKTGASPSARYPGDGSGGLKFAGGGLIDFVADGWKSLSNPLGTLKDEAVKLLDRLVGHGTMQEMITGVGKTIIDGAVNLLHGNTQNRSVNGYTGPISQEVAAVQNFIRAQEGKPYIWASAGPIGFDCSGLVSVAVNALTGASNLWSHTFSTMDEGAYFRQPAGSSPLTAAWTNPGEVGVGGGPDGVGHTAANLAGLAFESRGGDGVVIGPRVTPLGNFAHMGSYDSGGWLLPGITYAMNNTNSKEAIFTQDQLDEFRGGGGSDQTHYHLHGTQEELLDRLQARQAARDALNRVRRRR